MPNRQHYHIHVCLVRNEHPEFENALQQALSDKYFLTWDLIAHPTNFMDYSRQQIDNCNYCLFVLGNSYGHLSPSGVSFLHLSYIYAMTKRKPMLALIKNPAGNSHLTRQRIDLANLIEKDLNDKVIVFDRTQDAVEACQTRLKQLIQQEPVIGWQKADKIMAMSHDNVLLPRLTQNATNFGKPSIEAISSPTAYSNINANMVEPNTLSTQALELDKLNNNLLVNYSAHAYQDGNLQDVMATHNFTWQEIITLLKELPQPFSNDMMLRRLNESLKQVAMVEASRIMPNVHAVSRCQITNLDFQWIKNQLITNHWIIKDNSLRMGRELWKVNPTLV